jgi:hypothetical protein
MHEGRARALSALLFALEPALKKIITDSHERRRIAEALCLSVYMAQADAARSKALSEAIGLLRKATATTVDDVASVLGVEAEDVKDLEHGGYGYASTLTVAKALEASGEQDLVAELMSYAVRKRSAAAASLATQNPLDSEDNQGIVRTSEAFIRELVALE